MRQITDIAEYREIQMKIMDVIHDFCVKHNLTYSLSSGTLIGAIRHGGYIPWDDDIDIYMPRKSYNIFINSFKCQKNHYLLIDHRNCSSYNQTFAKVIDTETTGYENKSPIRDLGIWVDIFPVDGLPNSSWGRKLLFPFKRFFSMIIQSGIKTEEASITLKYLFCRFFPIPFSLRYKIFDFIITRWPNGSRLCNLSSGGPNYDKSFTRECFSDTIDWKFENRTYKIMNGWDVYLTNTYGDYMKIPPVSKQIRHDFIAYKKD